MDDFGIIYMKFGNDFWLILFREYISPKLFAVCPLLVVAKTFATYQYLAMSLEGGRDGRGTKVYYQGCEDFVQDTMKKTIYI
jgi:hypothetical protein